jgi:hypothetical protein
MVARTKLEQLGFTRVAFNQFGPRFEEWIYDGNSLTNFIVWTDSGKTVKKFEQVFTYSGNKIVTEVVDVYDESGSIEETETGAYVYSGNKLESVEWS